MEAPIENGDAADMVALVVRVETGVAIVTHGAGLLRASYGASLLAALASDRGGAPGPGDRVRLRRWPDGRTTVEQVLHDRRGKVLKFPVISGIR